MGHINALVFSLGFSDSIFERLGFKYKLSIEIFVLAELISKNSCG